MNLGDLRRTTPLSTVFGYDRGKPLDRRYIEDFLRRHAEHVRGRVLEIGDDTYTRQFGGDAVTHSDVFHRYPGQPGATFSGDLADAASLPREAFDCIILTQTLHLIYRMPDAVHSLHSGLRPGGALLVTVPYVCPIDRGEWKDSWYWSLTPLALKCLLEDEFGPGRVSVESYGNVLSATAFLYGLAEHELTEEELDTHDPCCPVTVMGLALKA